MEVGEDLAAGAFLTPALRLVRPLGAGGMGRVWTAEHLGLQTHVVVKLISDELASNPEAVARFSREAAAASQVKSPHVVHMIDYGVARNGSPYIAMELLEGWDLGQVLRARGLLAPGEVVAIVTQVSRALMAAHQRGIVHRDIKPDNIFLCDAGGGDLFVKVLDFGVAKSASAVHATSTGAMLGTPLYMSPEQALGEKTLDFRSDLWALGVVAFEALTGTVPFGGETLGAIAVAICHGPAPRPSARNPHLGPAVDVWFARACARHPSERFASAREMAEALGAALGNVPARLPAESLALRRDDPRRGPPAASPEVGNVTTSAATSRAVPTSAGRATVTRWARANRAAAVLIVAGAIGAGGGILAFAVTRRPTITPVAVESAKAIEPSAMGSSLAPMEPSDAGGTDSSTGVSPDIALPNEPARTVEGAGGPPTRAAHPARKTPSPGAATSTAVHAPSAAASHSAMTPTSPKAMKASDVILE